MPSSVALDPQPVEISTFPELQWYGNRPVKIAANGAIIRPHEVAPPPMEADTNGWDTAYVMDILHVNQAIAKKKSWPTNFDAKTDDGSSIKGTFGAGIAAGRWTHFENECAARYGYRYDLRKELHPRRVGCGG